MSHSPLTFPSNRESYRSLCAAMGDGIPLFQQAWWLDAVCDGKQWDVLLCGSDSQPSGALPFLYGRKYGLPYVLQPPLTMFTGPWLADPSDTDSLRYLAASLAALRLPLCMLRCSPEITDIDLFQQCGFKATSHLTHRLVPLRPLPELMARASALRRRDFDRVSSAYTLDTAVSPADLAALHASYFRSQRKRSLLAPDFIARVATAAIAHSHGLATGLRDSKGHLVATLFVVYDSRCAYLLLLARATTAPRNATATLVWHTIHHLLPLTQAFDFEGGNTPSLAQFYTSFGAKPLPLLQLTRCRPPLLAKILHL